MLDPTMMSSQLQPTPPQIPTPAAMPDAGEGKIKVALSSLPKGLSQGDTVSLKIASIDHDSAYLESDEPEAAPMDPNHDHDDEPEADEESAEPGMDTKTLLGPMNGLKNYLVQKSMDVPKNQGR